MIWAGWLATLMWFAALFAAELWATRPREPKA